MCWQVLEPDTWTILVLPTKYRFDSYASFIYMTCRETACRAAALRDERTVLASRTRAPLASAARLSLYFNNGIFAVSQGLGPERDIPRPVAAVGSRVADYSMYDYLL